MLHTLSPLFLAGRANLIFLTPAPAGFLHHVARSTSQNRSTPCSIWENRAATPAIGNRCEAHTAPHTTPHINPPCAAWCACALAQATHLSTQTSHDLCCSDTLIDSVYTSPTISRKQGLKAALISSAPPSTDAPRGALRVLPLGVSRRAPPLYGFCVRVSHLQWCRLR